MKYYKITLELDKGIEANHYELAETLNQAKYKVDKEYYESKRYIDLRGHELKIEQVVKESELLTTSLTYSLKNAYTEIADLEKELRDIKIAEKESNKSDILEEAGDFKIDYEKDLKQQMRLLLSIENKLKVYKDALRIAINQNKK